MKFYFIAVNYNGSSFTRKYIESINEIKLDHDDLLNIVIVDNNSKHEDKEKLLIFRKQFGNVKVVFSHENVGYFKGLNVGIGCIRADDHSQVIVGNNDLTFDEDFIEKLKNIDYADDILVIAPNITTKDGRMQNPHVIDVVPRREKVKAAIYNSNYYIGQTLRLVNQTLRRLRNKPESQKNNFGQMKIKRGIGACYVLTPNFFQHFSKLDDRVFMWGEEALLSNQVESAGGSILYDPTIRIVHHESASVCNILNREKYYLIRQSYKIYKKYL